MAKVKNISNILLEDKLPTPKELVAYLDQYVIGQEDAKKTLALGVYNHFQRVKSNAIADNNNRKTKSKPFDDVTIEKSNILMLGGTGTGKTYMVRTLAKILGIPCYIADATKFTESGYVGDDVESVLTGLLNEANSIAEQTDVIVSPEIGIVCIDEIDKLACRNAGSSLTRDVGGEGVQQGLLKIIEGCKVGVPPMGGRKHPEQQLVEIDTTNILFIGMGAFAGIEDIIKKRCNTRKSVGFGNSLFSTNDVTDQNVMDKVTTDDVKAFGLIPELIGRFSSLTHTNPLTVEDLFKIMTKSKNSVIKQYQKLMSMDGVKLIYSDDCLHRIAELALKNNTGARGLRTIIENVTKDVMFEYAGQKGKEIVITTEMVNAIYPNSDNISIAECALIFKLKRSISSIF